MTVQTTNNLTNNKEHFNCDKRQIKTHQCVKVFIANNMA